MSGERPDSMTELIVGEAAEAEYGPAAGWYAERRRLGRGRSSTGRTSRRTSGPSIPPTGVEHPAFSPAETSPPTGSGADSGVIPDAGQLAALLKALATLTPEQMQAVLSMGQGRSKASRGT